MKFLEEDNDKDFDVESLLSSSTPSDILDSVMSFLKKAFSKNVFLKIRGKC